MDNQHKHGGSDSRESHGLQISELHKALAEVKSLPRDITHIDPRNIRASLSVLKNTEKGTSNTRGSFRSRATLPENMSQLSNCQFPRRDQLRESLSAPVPLPVPNAASTSAEEGQLQPSLPSSHLVFLAHLVEKSKMLPSDSIFSIGERLKRHEIHPHILGVQAWSKRRSCGPQWIRPKQFPQTGSTTEWFFEDLVDLQRKLFLGASKQTGFQRNKN
ncbi:uncharacterized protein LOC119020119 [Acanthopagrus latus]|uniref:uncharacterized protein LOC119020119 n=1 Tax=Acanthopagrus latus TaxID=8177 RepID=UPI00187CF630|nr:uncharacterized protein LOC119020119 [Acanthopagrus latus]